MGRSKTFRDGPAWAGKNSNRGSEPPVSDGDIVKAEGTHMSGGETKNPKPSNKSKSYKEKFRTDGPHNKS